MVQEQGTQRCTDDELLHLIRKLRWIGMESDAVALEQSLRKARPHDIVLAEPPDTD
jgi:hypothetical protein